MNENLQSLLHAKALIFLSWLLLIFILERLAAAVPYPKDRRELTHNTGLAVINALLSPLAVLPVSLFAALHGLNWRPAFLQCFAVDLLILDIWVYFWHRANHEIRFLWRFHEVHHLDSFLDSTTALRFHFAEVLFSALARAPVIWLFGISFKNVIVFETLLLVVTVFHHSDLRLPRKFESVLSLLIVTPSVHWVHHHDRRKDTDSNYATIFSAWDRLFGTRSATRRTPDMTIGVEGYEGAKPGFLRLLLWPFRRV